VSSKWGWLGVGIGNLWIGFVTTVVVTQTQVGCIALGANAGKMVGFGIELGLIDFFALVGLSIGSWKIGRI